LVLDPQATKGLASILRGEEITLLIGPEGGLSEAELGLAQQAGFTGVRLGPRILRTETAAVAALTAIQALWGDLGGDLGEDGVSSQRTQQGRFPDPVAQRDRQFAQHRRCPCAATR
jgi:hypothetical protein